MLRLSKRTDYGLLALGHMGRGYAGEWFRVEDIATRFGIPLEQLSKVMQMLSRAELLTPRVGRNGGYSLARPLGDMSLREVMQAIDGEVGLMRCLANPDTQCDQYDACTIREPLKSVQDRLGKLLAGVTVAEATGLTNRSPESGEHARTEERDTKRG